jgi:hypothetical protein
VAKCFACGGRKKDHTAYLWQTHQRINAIHKQQQKQLKRWRKARV